MHCESKSTLKHYRRIMTLARTDTLKCHCYGLYHCVSCAEEELKFRYGNEWTNYNRLSHLTNQSRVDQS